MSLSRCIMCAPEPEPCDVCRWDEREQAEADAVDTLRADVARLTRELEEAREVLRAIEIQTYSAGHWCVACGLWPCYQGHAPGCRLVTVLGDF